MTFRYVVVVVVVVVVCRLKRRRTWFRVQSKTSSTLMDDTTQKNDPVHFGESRQSIPLARPQIDESKPY